MKVRKFIVLWHEDNDSGNLEHVMGVSPMFDSRDQAKAWIDEAVSEDDTRSLETSNRPLDVSFSAEDVEETYGNGQTTYYKIAEVEWEDAAADAIKEVKRLLNGVKNDQVRLALGYIAKHEARWLPLREWAVDIKFCPAACVHHVMARSGEEAEKIVNDMIDNHTLELTQEQKAEMMDNMLENVESTELVGPEDD